MKATKRSAGSKPKVAVKSITPFLWFNDQAEPAAKFYTSVFRGSKIVDIHREGVAKRGKAMVVTFTLAGQRFLALNGGPYFALTPAFSIYVDCPSQRTVDVLWKKLTAGGKESQCGWLVDKFGLSWQIIPTRLAELLTHPDPEKAGRALAAMMKMKKIDVPTLERACA